MATVSPIRPSDADDPRLLMHELDHRWANDLQLVVGSLQSQARRSRSDDARRELEAAADRVAMLAKARGAFREPQPTLESALCATCAALSLQAEPRAIFVSLTFELKPQQISEQRIAALMRIVNELATNAIKHAFDERGGRISIAVVPHDRRHFAISVKDDGHQLPDATEDGQGMGLKLARGFAESVGCTLIAPGNGSKMFEILVPWSD